MSLLQVKNLGVTFGQGLDQVKAVQDVSFSVQKGETLALVGESGSGKSVSALSILKLLPYPHASHPSGQILFQEKDLLTASSNVLQSIRGRKISMVFQEPMTSLNPSHSVGRQIAEVIDIHEPHLKPDVIQKRVVKLMTEVGFPDPLRYISRYPHQLSGGQRQRAMIAMALACQPDLMIADEPTTALDVTTQAQILKLLKSLQQTYHMGLLLITHDMDVVRYMADQVVVMYQGRVVEKGLAASVLENPQHPYTQSLLKAHSQTFPQEISPQAQTILNCKNIEVTYNTTKGLLRRPVHSTKAVDHISLILRAGETLGIVGESGSGKSTLALAILQLIDHQGTIWLKDQSLDTLKGKALRHQRRHMQIVFQDPYGSLSPRMTIGSIVGEGLGVHEPSLNKQAIDQQVCRILDIVGIGADKRHRYPHEFSGGQRQRIAIARALILRPSLIILDEPTSALDRTVQQEIMNLLKELQKDYSLSYLFISHDLKVIQAMCHRVMVLHQGKMVEEGEAEKIFYHPSHPYTQNLVKAAFYV